MKLLLFSVVFVIALGCKGPHDVNSTNLNDDCSCQVDDLDQFNNYKIYPILQSLLVQNYFRYFHVNLKKACPFWYDDSTCSMEYCQVQPCGDDEVPPGIKGQKGVFYQPLKNKLSVPETDCGGADLGYVNTSLSIESKKEFERWKDHDEALVDFCTVRDDVDADMQYVDLLLNPERFTGYHGPSAHRVWSSIYNENCFRETVNHLVAPFGPSRHPVDSCIEKRTFYRAISGLHSSINIHLSSKYLLTNKKSGSLFIPKAGALEWGPNLTEFRQHFGNALTAEQTSSLDQRSEWLKNLYFLFLLELRAISKISPFLQHFDLYTGNSEEDVDVKGAIKDLLRVVASFPNHFDEKALFSRKDAAKLKSDFHQRFTNISRIMDCVGCQKCKLWGKVQVKGLGTALKIVFSDLPKWPLLGKDFLTRNEIVALFNSFGRLSESIYELGNFRQMIEVEAKLNTKMKMDYSYK